MRLLLVFLVNVKLSSSEKWIYQPRWKFDDWELLYNVKDFKWTDVTYNWNFLVNISFSTTKNLIGLFILNLEKSLFDTSHRIRDAHRIKCCKFTKEGNINSYNIFQMPKS